MPRTGNSVAHQLAQMGVGSIESMLWFEDRPDLIRDALIEESM